VCIAQDLRSLGNENVAPTIPTKSSELHDRDRGKGIDDATERRRICELSMKVAEEEDWNERRSGRQIVEMWMMMTTRQSSSHQGSNGIASRAHKLLQKHEWRETLRQSEVSLDDNLALT
jgi:hypothetical protein